LPACRRCNVRKRLLTDVEFRARLAAEEHERRMSHPDPNESSAPEPPPG
jgi:hypothetical protein